MLMLRNVTILKVNIYTYPYREVKRRGMNHIHYDGDVRVISEMEDIGRKAHQR